MSHGFHDALQQKLIESCLRVYGERLVSLAVYGSVGRGSARRESDLDFLLVVEGLPAGRMRRMATFHDVERELAPVLSEGRAQGFHTELSPIFKSPEEISRGSLLMLDMV